MFNIYDQRNNHNLAAEAASRTNPEAKIKQPNFLSYTDPTGTLPGKQLKRALWFVKHEKQLYNLLLVGLIIINVVFWVFSLWRWIEYVAIGYALDRRLDQSLASSVDYTGIHEYYSPQPLSVFNTRVLVGGVEKYDVLAEVSNPNQRFLVEFDYHFLVDGTPTKSQHAVLLAGQTRPMVHFGIEGSVPPASVSLVMENVAWRRISAKLVASPSAWQAERLDLGIDNFVFGLPEGTTGPSAYVIQFTINNKSSFGYRRPEFIVGLMQSGAMVGVAPLTLEELPSLGKTTVDVRNFAPQLTVTDVQLFPLMNLYDPAVYLPPPS